MYDADCLWRKCEISYWCFFFSLNDSLAVVVPDGEPGSSSPWQEDLVPASVLSGLAVFAVWFLKTPIWQSEPHICGLLWFLKGFLSTGPVCQPHNAHILLVTWICLRFSFFLKFDVELHVWCELGSLNQYLLTGYSVFVVSLKVIKA